MPRYAYALDEPAVATLGVCDDAEFGALIRAFESLAENPHQSGHTRRTLRDGYVINLAQFGEFDIAYHVDHELRRLWILEIHRI